MTSSRRAVGLGALCLVLLAGGCSISRPRPELPVVRVKDAAELLNKTLEKNPIHDTLRGQARVSVSSLAENYRADEMIFSK